MSRRRRVIVESPLRAETEQAYRRNLQYLDAALLDCLQRGESPYASHKLFPSVRWRQGLDGAVLDDDDPEERRLGIEAGFAWRSAAEATVVYTDRGISRGMKFGIEHAESLGHPVEYRSLDPRWAE